MSLLQQFLQGASRAPAGLFHVVFGQRQFDDDLKLTIVADPRAGKSTLVDEFLAAVADQLAPRLPADVEVTPSPAGTRKSLPGYPPRTEAPIRFQGTIQTSGRRIEFELIDHPGELTQIWPKEADNDDNSEAQTFFATVRAVNFLLLAFSPADLLGRSKAEREDLLERMGYLVSTAASKAARTGPFYVAVVFTKTDELGIADLGPVRLLGNGGGALAAARALRSASAKEEGARFADFLSTVSANGPSAEAVALRRQLVELTGALWARVFRHQDIDPRNVNGYLLRARPVELTDHRREGWAKRGVLHPFADFFDAVRCRNAAAPLRPWMAVVVALLAAGAVAFGIVEQGKADTVRRYQRAYPEGPDFLDPRGRPYSGADAADRGLGQSAHDPAGVGRALFDRAMNDRLDGLARRLAGLPAGATPLELIQARRATLDWSALWEDLGPAARAAVEDRSTGLKDRLDDFRKIEEELEGAEEQLAAFVVKARGELKAKTATAPISDLLHNVADLHRRIAVMSGRVRELRQAPIGRAGFVRPSPALERRSVQADILGPWCDRADALIAGIRTDATRMLDRAFHARPQAYLDWLRARTDAETKVVRELGPELPTNPYLKDFLTSPVAPAGGSKTWWASGRCYAYLRVRHVPRGWRDAVVYDIDLDTRDVYRVGDNGEPTDEPVRGEGPLRKADQLEGWAVGWRLDVTEDELELVGAFLRGRKNDPYRPVTVTCRGQDRLWLPAALDGLVRGDRALTVGGLDTPELRREWERLRIVLSKLRRALDRKAPEGDYHGRPGLCPAHQ